MKLLNYLRNRKRIVFIIGTGRTGTHLLGRTLGSVSTFDVFIEDKRVFYTVAQMVARENYSKKQVSKVLSTYKRIFETSHKKWIVEKTHPNIWIVEDLETFFPLSKFIGIKRNIYATVSSMLQHERVLEWYSILPQDKVNDFLGISKHNIEEFQNLPLESKCALRVISHFKRLDYLQRKFPQKVLLLNYESFYDNNKNIFLKIQDFLNSDEQFKLEPLNINGKDKWKRELSERQKNNISEMIKISNYND